MSIENTILKEFEKEIWLYLDNDLSEERMLFWAKQIEQNKELEKEMKLLESTLTFDCETTSYNLNEFTFNKMIDKTINQKSWSSSLKNYFSKLLFADEEHLFGKITFASLLVVFAVIVSLTSNNPNPTKTIVKTVKSEILEWDAKAVDKQISRIGTLLMLAKNDDYKKYYINKVSSNKWRKNTFEMESKITKLKNDLGNENF
ncbi:MAG: hypothetical protein V3V16_15075 [Melioribacteraceae bacterium]